MDKATLLVVEDDISLMEGIRDYLESTGYRVVTATNGLEALDLLRKMEQPPDLIISDIGMPQMNGYEFFEAVHQEGRWLAIPFIFLSAKAEKQSVRYGKELGADDYVTKPFEPEDLLAAVRSKLKRTRQLRAVQEARIEDTKRKILTILNHEFRTPLTYVLAYSDMLYREADDLSDREFREFLEGVRRGSERLRHLIENFIFLVELETGEARNSYMLRRRRIDDIPVMCAEVIESLRPMADERGVTLELEVAPEIPAPVADKEYLRKAITHLVENGIKFTEEGSGKEVRLRVVPSNGKILFQVIDHGRGIPEAELERIWEAFYQIDRSKYEDPGAGAGLAIAKGVAEIHGGEIEVESQVGVGSTFTFVLPVEPPPENQEAPLP